MHSIDISEEAGVRFLHFGSDWIQGAMRSARPYDLELEYTREMMLPLLYHGADWPRRVLLIGLGSGSLLKFLWRHRPRARLTVAEIDPRMEAMARQCFKLPDDAERIRIHVADGADFVIGTRQRFDLILVDGFDADARPGQLDSVPFYLDCRARLADEGIFCVNLLSRRREFGASVGRLRDAFEHHLLALPSGDAGNAIVIAARPDAVPPSLTFEELTAAAKALRKSTGLNLSPLLARLAQARKAGGGL